MEGWYTDDGSTRQRWWLFAQNANDPGTVEGLTGQSINIQVPLLLQPTCRGGTMPPVGYGGLCTLHLPAHQPSNHLPMTEPAERRAQLPLQQLCRRQQRLRGGAGADGAWAEQLRALGAGAGGRGGGALLHPPAGGWEQ
jgi:hypothetical protein